MEAIFVYILVQSNMQWQAEAIESGKVLPGQPNYSSKQEAVQEAADLNALTAQDQLWLEKAQAQLNRKGWSQNHEPRGWRVGS